MSKKITINKLLTVFMLVIALTAGAQNTTKIKHKPSIMLGVGALKYTGYIGSHTNVNPLLDSRLCYFLAVEQRFGKILGVEVGGTYGKLAGTDNQISPTTMFVSNMESTTIQGQAMLTLNFDGVMKADPMVSPFFKVGVGYMMFTTKSDLLDAHGSPYMYSSDGSITSTYSVVIGGVSTATTTTTKRDYKYETQIKTNGQTGSLVIPAMLGLNFNFGKHMSSMIGLGYTYCLSNWIDGSGKGTAAFVNAQIGLRYKFGKKAESADAQYKDVDFASVDHLDADKDGVPDDQDMCHGTPKGVKVDAKGCPLDGDGDGVPDYLDKEPTTAKGNKVDGFGVTVDEAALAQHQKEWETEAPERSKQFNVLPSAAYLKKVEADAKANKAKTASATSKIPAELRSADINNDGFISADEITKTIDSFFDGAGDFTVEKINKLIDFFFEQ
ncbi:MAG: thrombospondin type 3 repeat-containing protein [Bacteroidia bacterium]